MAKPVTVAGYGTAFGEVIDPENVAVDQVGNDVYVADYRSERVDEFDQAGGFLLDWVFPEYDGSSNPPHGLAVAQSSGDVWVSDNEGVEEFDPSGEPLRAIAVGWNAPLAVDGAGDVWIGEEEQVQELSPSGVHMATVALPGLGGVHALAVTASGADIYVILTGGIREYETATGLEVGSPIDETGEPEAISLDSAGDLYVGGECGKWSIFENKCSKSYSFKEYNASGVQLEQFGAGEVIGHPGGFAHAGDGIAIDESGAALYSTSDAEGAGLSAVQRFPLPVPGPLAEGESASGVTSTSARIEASLDPENHQTTYQFEYGTEPGVYSHSTTLASSPASFADETVLADLTGLLPETTYYYRLTATNHCNEAKPSEECTIHGPGERFTTLPAVDVESESALAVASGSASFEGVLNPLGTETKWWVEYGTQEGVYDHSTTVEPLGSGSTGVTVGVHVQGLDPALVYYYRFAASDTREGHSYTSYGRALSFTTQLAAPSFALPDGRVWEQVSPENKQDASFLGIQEKEAGVIEAAADGDGIAYLATASIEALPPGAPSPDDTPVLSMHGAGGWSSHDIASPHEQGWIPEAGKKTEFYAFSPDLSVGLVEPRGGTLLGGASEDTPYLRRQALCEGYAGASECYLPLVTSENVTSGEKWGGSPAEEESGGGVHYIASTPDLSHVLLNSPRPLTVGASGSGIYEWSGGQLELVSTLPGTAVPAGGCPGVNETGDHLHVISNDGDRVIWEDNCVGNGGGHLYMHEAAGDRTVQLDVLADGSSGSYENDKMFQDANSEGSLVFFSSGAQLTSGSSATRAEPDLYVYEANADTDPEPGVVREVTVPVAAGEDADVLSVPGVSASGSVAYVVAGGVLSTAGSARGETARAGEPNLYRIERVEQGGSVNWVASFIATLSQQDSQKDPVVASVSSNGQWLAFMSNRSLTNYDNRDALSGEPDEEVYLYHAPAAGVASPGSLVCASCDPTGARPHGTRSIDGAAKELLIDNGGTTWEGRWVAGVIPGWDTKGLGETVYQSRYLSDSGRLFFDSADALVPQDVNNTTDVYEYEPPGVGSCTSAAESYSARQEGCVGLISSGISSEESVFLDASENGNDVFFLTSGKLVPQDADSAYDVYDAHVCGSGGAGGAEWACASQGEVSPPCSNTSSCRGAGEPQPSVFGAPPSATFSGTGNIAPATVTSTAKAKPKAKIVKCKKGFVKKKGKCVKQKPKGKAKKAAAKRASNDRRARS